MDSTYHFLRGQNLRISLLPKFSLLPWSLYWGQNQSDFSLPLFYPPLPNGGFYYFSVSGGNGSRHLHAWLLSALGILVRIPRTWQILHWSSQGPRDQVRSQALLAFSTLPQHLVFLVNGFWSLLYWACLFPYLFFGEFLLLIFIWTIFKAFIEQLKYYFCFMVFFFLWPQNIWDLSSPPGIKPTPPLLKGEVLIAGPPGKFLFCFYFFYSFGCFWGTGRTKLWESFNLPS